MRIPLFLALAATASSAPLERWVYAPTNLLVAENVQKLESLMKRAKPLGYTHFLVADSKFSRLAQMDQPYFKNLGQVKKTAAEVGLEIVPAIFPVGYSNDILWNNPNLAEGLPVKDALFVVKNGEARVEADPPVGLPPLAERKKWGFIDEVFQPADGALRVTDPKGVNCRAMKSVKVAPFRQYHVSVRVKTENFKEQPQIAVLVGNHALNYTYLHAKPTQDWTTHHITFNSLENSEVGVYFGAWGARGGSLWIADPTIEESGAVNLLRRDGAPLVVKKEDGTVLKEGADFEPWHDSRMGNQPYAGEFEVWHEAPPLKTKLPDGTRLRVSYYHPHIVYDEQVCACVSEPEFMNLLHQQARDVHKAWGAQGYMMSHDEWRVLGWDESCQRRHLTPGAMVADNARSCVGFLREVNPAGRIYVWSDMFDPYHNAVKDYYLVKGDLTGSWEGIDKNVVIMNWNFGKRADSLKFFADRGHRQILAGYYDDKPEQIGQWLDAAKGVTGVIGVMYTTWRNNYSDLEAFAKVVDRSGNRPRIDDRALSVAMERWHPANHHAPWASAPTAVIRPSVITQLRLLAQFEDFHGWDVPALWDDIKFATKQCTDVERIAMVGEKTWEKWMATVCKPFIMARVRYFDRSESDAAGTWLAEPA